MSEELPKLKPCPFCGGGEAIELRETWVVAGFKWYVMCGDCWGHGPLTDLKKEACTSWNGCVRGTERDALATETEEQAWEIAKLRYYVEALERRLTPEDRQTAVDEASIALSQHNPPEWMQNYSRHPVK